MNVSLNIVNCKHWSLSDRPPIGLCAIGAKNRPSPGACFACAKRDPAVPYIDLILVNGQGAGDQVLLTAAVRDIHHTHPGKFRTAVQCWGRELFENNPYLTPIDKMVKPRTIRCEGFMASDDASHLIYQVDRNLSRQLDVHMETKRCGGDIHLSLAERQSPHPFGGEPYWLAWFGGHYGFTTKIWSPRNAQAVVDHFRGRLRFVQVGAKGHFHPKIEGADYRVGDTPMRKMVLLMYHADGGIGPVSFGMHLAAAVPVSPRPGMPSRRPFVVLVGGREAPQVFQYPNHTAISSIGRMRCCQSGACWKNNSQGGMSRPVDCEQTVADVPNLSLARCMVEDVTPGRVIEAIEMYLDAAEQAKAHARQAQDDAYRIADESRAVCATCDKLDRLSPAGLIAYCKSSKACVRCGQLGMSGAVNLMGKCPEGKWSVNASAGLPLKVLVH
jgi:hypothetical protein